MGPFVSKVTIITNILDLSLMPCDSSVILFLTRSGGDLLIIYCDNKCISSQDRELKLVSQILF